MSVEPFAAAGVAIVALGQRPRWRYPSMMTKPRSFGYLSLYTPLYHKYILENKTGEVQMENEDESVEFRAECSSTKVFHLRFIPVSS